MLDLRLKRTWHSCNYPGAWEAGTAPVLEVPSSDLRPALMT